MNLVVLQHGSENGNTLSTVGQASAATGGGSLLGLFQDPIEILHAFGVLLLLFIGKSEAKHHAALLFVGESALEVVLCHMPTQKILEVRFACLPK
jgi:hypothetical protein